MPQKIPMLLSLYELNRGSCEWRVYWVLTVMKDLLLAYSKDMQEDKSLCI